MEPVLTPQEMAAADEATIRGGVPGFELMERAAYACSTVALRMMGAGYGRRVLVVAGKGNNGGDGIALARHLARAGAAVTLYMLGEPKDDSDPGRHLAITRRAAAVRVRPWSKEAFASDTRRADLVVDAVFGTGFSGEPQGAPGEACATLDAPGPPLLAVDIPSGVAGVDGSVPGAAARADVTVAIAALKVGHVALPGTFRCGRVDVSYIGIPIEGASRFVPMATDVRDGLPALDVDTHKYRVGVVALLAGSAGMTGAAILSATGALRGGAGLVLMGIPRSSSDVIEATVVEAVKSLLPDTEGRLDAKSLDEFEDRLSTADVLAIGPGLGRGEAGLGLVRQALELHVPLVCDADALWALGELRSDDADVLQRRSAPTVLTPHTGEMARLLGREVGSDRITEAREAATSWGAVVHLKGRRAITAAPDGRVWVNPTGNPGMATGGTGDILTGVIAALVARGMDAADATWAGAWLQGTAGDLAAGRLGRASMAAGDVAASLPLAFARLRTARPPGRLRTVLPHPEALG